MPTTVTVKCANCRYWVEENDGRWPGRGACRFNPLMEVKVADEFCAQFAPAVSDQEWRDRQWAFVWPVRELVE